MTYRPICDTWLLARSKVKYYGAYPAGFLLRARSLLGVSLDQRVLHVCAGRVREYPYAGLGPHDATVDQDPTTDPTYCVDIVEEGLPDGSEGTWDAVLCDPPYTDEDAANYAPGASRPTARHCLTWGLEAVKPGGRVGLLHYVAPRPPRGVQLVALVSVIVGFENRVRVYSVYEPVTA